MNNNGLRLNHNFVASTLEGYKWYGDQKSICREYDEIVNCLYSFNKYFYVLKDKDEIVLAQDGELKKYKDEEKNDNNAVLPCLGILPSFKPEQLGDSDFCNEYGLKYAYMGGSMANGISSEDMVIELGKNGFLGSFGSGGLSLNRIEIAIHKIQKHLPCGPYVFNILHNQFDLKMEWETIVLYLKYGVKIIEASAFLRITPAIVYYRACGLGKSSDGNIIIQNKIIAKLSRQEIAQQFMKPAPVEILNDLLNKGLITKDQLELAKTVPVADDITIEGDSGGHTDNGLLISIFPGIMKLRDEIQAKYNYKKPIRLGASGGIALPESVLAAFAMGASYIVTASINQPTVEARTSDHVKKMLEKAELADVTMTPSADMFESGSKVQVLKRGTFFPVRAQKMYDLYKQYSGIDSIPNEEIKKLEKQFFKKSISEVWNETKKFFYNREYSSIIEKAEINPKLKMALIFRWYLGQTSNWAIIGEKGREMDYQVWCGPSLGGFNSWVKGTALEKVENRKVAEIAKVIINNTTYLNRVSMLKSYNISVGNKYYEKDTLLSKVWLERK